MAEKDHFILGLDLGSNSIGWALLKAVPSEKEGRLKPFAIEKTGVRIFEAGVDGDIASGKDQSRGVVRRDARLTRRRLDRTSRRLSHLFYLLMSAGLLPEHPAYQTKLGKKKSSRQRKEERHLKAQARHEIINRLDQELIKKWQGKEPMASEVLPYLLRAKALDQKLEPDEFGRALFHLAQRRGFLSNRKANSKKDEDFGIVKADIEKLAGEIEGANVRTLGEYLSKLNPEQIRIRGRWTGRDMYSAEFEEIWGKQIEYFPQMLNPEFRERIKKAIFHQRPLKPPIIGVCEYEKGRKRAPKACLTFQRFRTLQQLQNTKVVTTDGEIKEFTEEQMALLLKELDIKEELTFSQVKALLKPLKVLKFNFEGRGEKGFRGNRTAAQIIDVIGFEKWMGLPVQDREEIVRDLISIQHEKGLVKRGKEKWGLDDKTAEKFSAIELEDGYCGLSRMALSKLLPLMENGMKYMESVKNAYPDRFKGDARDCLPMVHEELPELSNPVVKRVLTELRKVVNAIVREYGKPAEIRLELVRDTKRTRQSREIHSKMNEQNRAERDKARNILKEIGIQNPSRDDLDKYLLAEECDWKCPYTGKGISMANLFGKNPQFQIEHIIPFKICLDNSFINKTLCANEENAIKGKKSPWQAYGSDQERWSDILRRVKDFKPLLTVSVKRKNGKGFKKVKSSSAQAKLERFQIDSLEKLSDFVDSQLIDTAYAASKGRDYLGLLYGEKALGRVQTTKGGITSYLRGKEIWDLNRILSEGGDKARTDHRHHAIDAICIALTDRAIVNQLSKASENAQKEKRHRFGKMDEPWGNFYEKVKEAIDQTIVSHRVSKKVNGPLHADHIYSPQKVDERGNTYSHIRKPIAALTNKELENIVDPVIKKLVIEKLKSLGGDIKKFENIENHPFMETKDGRKIPINKVRIKKPNTTIPIGKPVTLPDGTQKFTRNLETSSNHHIEIFEAKDKKGNPYWDADVVTTFEAMRRLRTKGKEPIVKRNHGEGTKFIFSLARNESVLMKDDKGIQQLWIVQKIGQNQQMFFVKNTDARPVSEIPKEGRSRYPESLRVSEAKKVLIDPMGNIRWAND